MILAGTCGFSFEDWKGPVYPQKINNSHMLEYYNRILGFKTVEIDVSYYRIPSSKVTHSWVKKTDDDFTFAVKCHKSLTLNEEKSPLPAGFDNSKEFDVFIESFKPIIQSGKLMTFLAQFGPVFVNHKNNRDYILRLKEKFNPNPLVVEFRHKSWLTGENKEKTFTFLIENDLGYAIVDEPQLRSLAPFEPYAANNIGYFRLHGRNTKWFEGNRSTRYDYSYSDDELRGFIPHIQKIASVTAITPIFFNNCHAGAAYANAIRLMKLIDTFREEYDCFSPDSTEKFPSYHIPQSSIGEEQLDLPF